MKRSTLTVLGLCAAATLTAFVASPAPVMAGDAPATTQPGKHAPKEHPYLEKLKTILPQLDLTADQKPKVDDAITATSDKLKTIREEKGKDRPAIMEASKAAIDELNDKLKAILTPDQAKKLHDLMGAGEKHEKHGDKDHAKAP